MSDDDSPPQHPLQDDVDRSIFDKLLMTPPIVLLLLSVQQFFIFVDRGAFSGSIVAIREDHRLAGSDSKPLTSAEAGLVSSLFMLGFTFSAPFFASIRMETKTILLVGSISWVLACILSAVSTSFSMLCVARVIDGVAEAAGAPFGSTVIDNIAPPGKRVLWQAIYFSMIPFGEAAGMAIGGILSTYTIGPADNLVSSGWRFFFLVISLPGLIVTLFFFLLPREYNVHTTDDDNESTFEGSVAKAEAAAAEGDLDTTTLSPLPSPSSPQTKHVPFTVAFVALFCNVEFVLLASATAAYDFILTEVATWLIPMLRQGPWLITAMAASILSGCVMMVSGLGGAIFGGWISDYCGAGIPGALGVQRAALTIAALTAASIPFAVIAITASDSTAVFFSLFFPGAFLLLGVHPCLTNAVLRVVGPELRTHAIALQLFVMHIGGDAPAPVVIGALADGLSGRCTMATDPATCLQLEPNSSAVLGVQNKSIPFLLSANDSLCRWMPADQEGDTSFCASVYALRDAMAIGLLNYLLLLPMVLAVAWRMRRRIQGFDGRDSDDGGDSLTPGSTLRDHELGLVEGINASPYEEALAEDE